MWEEIEIIQEQKKNQEEYLSTPKEMITSYETNWKPHKGRFYLRWQNLATLEILEGRTGLDDEEMMRELVSRCNREMKGWNYWYEKG